MKKVLRPNLALIINPVAERAAPKKRDLLWRGRKGNLRLVPRVKPVKALPGGEILNWFIIGSFLFLTVSHVVLALGVLAMPVLGWLGLL